MKKLQITKTAAVCSLLRRSTWNFISVHVSMLPYNVPSYMNFHWKLSEIQQKHRFAIFLMIRLQVDLSTSGTPAFLKTCLLVSSGLRWTSLLILLIVQRHRSDFPWSFPLSERSLQSWELVQYLLIVRRSRCDFLAIPKVRILLWSLWTILDFSD